MNGNPSDRSTRHHGMLAHMADHWKLMVILLFSMGVYLVVSLASGLAIRQYYGIDGPEMMTRMEAFLQDHGSDLNTYRWLQILSTVMIFGATALGCSFLFSGRLTGEFRFSRKCRASSILYIPLIMLLALPVIALVYDYASRIPAPDSFRQLEEGLELLTLALLQDPSWKIFALNFIMIAVLPALCEELLFRGLLQKYFTRVTGGHHAGILATGLLFGFIHGQVFKFLPIAALGILLGYLYWWTRNLWFPILAHFFNNGIQVVFYFLVARGWTKMDAEAAEMLPPGQTLLFTVLFAGVLYLFYHVNLNTEDEPI